MNTQKTAPDFGEPWKANLNIRGVAVDCNGTYVIDTVHKMKRAIACVNACAGMSDPAAEIQALRDAASCLSRLVDHGHAEDCLFLNRANAPCDCGVDQAQATLAKLRSIL